MQFLSVGSAYGFAKFAQLNVKWKKREGEISKRTMQSETPQMKQMREEAARIRKANMISTIDAKLKGGGELDSDELEYLKANSPELYKEAVDIIRERQAYKKELENCRTKEEVAKLNANKVNGALSVARAIGSNTNIPKLKRQQEMEKILKRVMGIQSEHVRFIKTPRYEELPREHEIVDEEKGKRKEKIAEDENVKAPEKLVVRFEDVTDELQKILDGISTEKTDDIQGAQGAERAEGAKGEEQAKGTGHNKVTGGTGIKGENGTAKSGGEAPRSHPAVKITIGAKAAPAAKAPPPKIYTASGSVKVAPSVSPPRAKVSIKA